MANFCRICHFEGIDYNDTLVTCNNCGSSACENHHTWWPDSKNAFCTECFPAALTQAVNQAAAGLGSMRTPQFDRFSDDATPGQIRNAVEATLRDQDLSIDDLIKILRSVTREIRRRFDKTF